MAIELIIGGGMRCATTAVLNNLQSHPDVSVLRENQLYFNGDYIGWPFANPLISQFQRGYGPEIYESLAANAHNAGRKITIAKQPYFLAFPHIAFGLREHLPKIKLLFILRPQADVLYSAFKKFHAEPVGDEVRPRSLQPDATGRSSTLPQSQQSPQRNAAPNLEQFIGIDDMYSTAKNFREESSRRNWHADLWTSIASPGADGRLYLERGFYFEHLKRFFLLFPREQIMVLKFSDYVASARARLQEISRFCDIDDTFAFPNADNPFNPSTKDVPLDSVTRSIIEDFYSASNQRLFKLLGWNGF